MTLNFKPKASLKKIIDDPLGASIYFGYRRGHMISDRGSMQLEYSCREAIRDKKKGKLDTKNPLDVTERLRKIYNSIQYADTTSLFFNEDKAGEWAQTVLPFITGNDRYEYKVVSEKGL